MKRRRIFVIELGDTWCRTEDVLVSYKFFGQPTPWSPPSWKTVEDHGYLWMQDTIRLNTKRCAFHAQSRQGLGKRIKRSFREYFLLKPQIRWRRKK
jgi:hypothetical protein